METLFENRYTVNLRMLRSFSRGASFSQKFFFRFSLVGMAVCALALVYCLLFLPGDYNAMVSPAVSFLLCLMLFFFPSLTAQIVYRNNFPTMKSLWLREHYPFAFNTGKSQKSGKPGICMCWCWERTVELSWKKTPLPSGILRRFALFFPKNVPNEKNSHPFTT